LTFSRIDFYRLRDFEFLRALFAAIEQQIGEGKQFERKWKHLAPLQQGLYAWWIFWGDAENGGLVQYFYNHGDQGVPGLVALLKATGSQPLANLVTKGSQIYRKRRAQFNTDKVWGNDGLFAKLTELNQLDEAVCGHLENAGKRIEKWLRANSQQVFVGNDGQPIDPQFSGEIETTHANGKVFEQATLRRGLMTGAYRRFLPDGTLDHAEFYEKGKVSGDYWPSGQLKKRTTKKAQRTIVEWFYPSGQLHKRYVTGKSGDVIEPIRLWHENGQLAEELHKQGRDRFGPWLKFFPDGRPKLVARHGNDQKLIIENAWDDDGRQTVKQGTGTYVTEGQNIDWAYDVYFPDGSHWIRSLPLRRGKLHGQGHEWHDGVLWSQRNYKDDQVDGEMIHYYDNGRIRSRSQYRAGKEISVESFPKFDHPVPAVMIDIEVNATLYAGWKLPLPDVYPKVKNHAKLQAGLPIPEFLQEVYERNLAGTVKEDYEDLNRFNDFAAFLLRIDERGEVERVELSGSSAYSIAVAETYLPVLKRLRFTPARLRGNKVPSQAFVLVRHTFVEGNDKSAKSRKVSK
jgi:antitoxin component YwqK of YwqJK toxin-antitoxin module